MASLLSLLPNFSLSLLPLFFASPLTTLSTSLNVLLLNLTYTSLTLSYTPLRIEAFLTLSARVLFFLLPALVATAILNLAPGYAIDGAFAKRAGKRGGKVDPKEVGWGVARVLVNVVLPVCIQAGIEYFLTQAYVFPSALRLPRTLPMPGTILWDVFWVFVLRAVIGYTVHRYVLHDPRGGRQSDWHWTYVHEKWGSRVTPLLPLLDHPINHLLGSWLPIYLSSALLRTHLLTYTLIVSLTSLDSILSHSYLSPPSFLLHIFPFYAWSPFHLFAVKSRVERHYENDGECAFEGWGVVDWLNGSSGGDGEGPEGAERRVRNVPREVRKARSGRKRGGRMGR